MIEISAMPPARGPAAPNRLAGSARLPCLAEPRARTSFNSQQGKKEK